MSWFKSEIKKSNPFPISQNDLGCLAPQKNFEQDITFIQDPIPNTNKGILGLSLKAQPFYLAIFFLSAIFLFFTGRVIYLQIFQGDYYRGLAEKNRFYIEYLSAERGIITDRNDKILVENSPAFSLVMTIDRLPKNTIERETVFNRVIDLAGLQRADLDLLIQEYSDVATEEIVVKKDLNFERAILAMSEEENLTGFTVKFGTKRHYNSSAVSFSQLLGYTGKINSQEFTTLKEDGYRRVDEIGKAGVEKSWETALHGQTGKRLIEVDAAGQAKTIFSEEPPIKGEVAKLTIDADLQVVLEKSLQTAMEKIGKQKGVAIVTNPNTGEILALVGLPSYDSNLFAGSIEQNVYQNLLDDPNQPLFPRAVAGEFPPGSTFKPYIATAALTEGVIIPTTSFLSAGGLRVGQWFFPDWKGGGHGVTNVYKALAESVNTFFYIVGGGFDTFTGLGVERITSYAALFGFGQPTGIDLPSEAAGFLPSKEWKEETKGERWYVGDTYHLAIGQGDLLVTPIQMAQALDTVANGGIKYSPHVVLSLDGKPVEISGEKMSEAITEVLPIVREGMRQCVTSGSCRQLDALPITSAGKTGTAQIGGTEETHSWFTGFAPYENPEIAITILIEEGGQGSTTAIPVAREIFQWWYNNRK
ncbi:MAG: penicillin-binding protein 2 [Candidatus Uhrbacteria bacterium]